MRRLGFTACAGLVIWLTLYFLPAPVSPVSGNITYFADWDTSGIETLPDGGWRVTNDLGYEVHVLDGYVVSYRVTSLECSHSHSLFEWLLEQLMPAPVKAGHGSEADPAMLAAPFIESLVEPESREWGTVTVNEPSYCQGHYLLGKADRNTEGVDQSIEGTTLFIHGTYSGQPFTIKTGLAWGHLHDFMQDDRPVHVQIGEETVKIMFTRQLSTLFDGLDFDTFEDDERAHAVLRNLTHHMSAHVMSGSVHVNP